MINFNKTDLKRIGMMAQIPQEYRDAVQALVLKVGANYVQDVLSEFNVSGDEKDMIGDLVRQAITLAFDMVQTKIDQIRLETEPIQGPLN